MNKKFSVITCPFCGKEYLPAEIFIPKVFFGNPQIIYRNDDKQITGYIGTNMDTEETYRCDHCNKQFKVNTKLIFSTSMDEIDFDNDYESKINK